MVAKILFLQKKCDLHGSNGGMKKNELIFCLLLFTFKVKIKGSI